MRRKADEVWKRYRLSFTTFVIQSFAVLHILLSFWANSDLSTNPSVLRVEEQIVYQSTNSLIHPRGLNRFTYDFFVGAVPYYGKFFLNFSGLMSFMFKFFLHESGQIIAVRMLWAIVLSLSYLTLVFTLLQRSFYRILCFTVVTFLPGTFFYSTLPRPEALQLFFLVVFMATFYRLREKLGWHWIFLGLAAGTVPTFLSFLIIFMGYAWTLEQKRYKLDRLAMRTLFSLGFFFIGLIIATPSLVPWVLFGTPDIKRFPALVDPWSKNTFRIAQIWHDPRFFLFLIMLVGLVIFSILIYRYFVTQREMKFSILNNSLQFLFCGFLLSFVTLMAIPTALEQVHVCSILVTIGIFQFMELKKYRRFLIPLMIGLVLLEFSWSFARYRQYSRRSSASQTALGLPAGARSPAT